MSATTNQTPRLIHSAAGSRGALPKGVQPRVQHAREPLPLAIDTNYALTHLCEHQHAYSYDLIALWNIGKIVTTVV